LSIVLKRSVGADTANAPCVLLATELANEGVEGGCEGKAKQGHAEHPEQHRCTQRSPHLCACSGRDGKRGNAQDEREFPGSALQDVELMSERKVFSFQRGTRSEQPDQCASNQPAEIAHRANYRPIRGCQSAGFCLR
jgi:hypothetical protein